MDNGNDLLPYMVGGGEKGAVPGGEAVGPKDAGGGGAGADD